MWARSCGGSTWISLGAASRPKFLKLNHSLVGGLAVRESQGTAMVATAGPLPAPCVHGL